MSVDDDATQGGDVTQGDAGQDAPAHGRMPGALAWVTNRLGMEELMEDQYNRIVPIHATNYIYCFGGIAFILFLILAVTGILLVVYYQPTPDAAYQSVVNISTNVSFGWWVRSIHKWAATGMVVLVFVHCCGCSSRPSYKRPRELNWISGVVLLGVTMAFGFTGYLLPWDQKAYWATRVGTDIAGSTPLIGHFLLVSLRGGENITRRHARAVLHAARARPAGDHHRVPRSPLLDDPPARHLGPAVAGRGRSFCPISSTGPGRSTPPATTGSASTRPARSSFRTSGRSSSRRS